MPEKTRGNNSSIGLDRASHADQYKGIRSPRKYQILKILYKEGAKTSKEISDQLGITIHNAAMQLLSYQRGGLVTCRDPVNIRVIDKRYTLEKGRPAKVYRITDRGKERLEYFEKSIKNKGGKNASF